MELMFFARLMRAGLYSHVQTALNRSRAACRGMIERCAAKLFYGLEGSWLSGAWSVQTYGLGTTQQMRRLQDWSPSFLPTKRYITALCSLWGGAKRSPVVARRSGNLDAQWTDFACSLRNLTYRLGTPERHLICSGSLGTLVSDDAPQISQQRSAQPLLGAPFEDDAAIPETREVLSSFRAAEGMDQHHGSVRAFPYQKGTLPSQAVLISSAAQKGAALAVAEGVSKMRVRIMPDRRLLAERVTSFVASARSGFSEALLYLFFNDRMHVWVRKLARKVGELPGLKIHGERARVLVTPSRALHSDQRALCGSVCKQDGDSNGCFYCAGPRASELDRALAAPGRVRHAMAALLSRLGRPTLTNFGIEGPIEDVLVGTYLEQRFLGALSKLYGGTEVLKPQVLHGGQRGFVLRAGTSETPRLWSIEPQVNMDIRFPGLSQKRVDFLLTPIGRGDARPIAVKIDQSDCHARSAGKDVLDCVKMIRSDALFVWNLSSRDLELDDQASSRSFSQISLGSVLVERLKQVLAHPQFAPHADGITDLLTGSSLQGLQYLLDGMVPGNDTLQSALIRVLVATGQPLEYLPVFSELTEAGQKFLAGPGLAERIGEGAVVLYLTCGQLSSTDLLQSEAELRLVLRADLPDPGRSLSARAGVSDVCEDLWRLVHLFQGLGGFHLEIGGLDSLPPPAMSDNIAKIDAPVSEWRQVRALCDVRFHPLINAMIAADVPTPDRFGDDLVSDGRVVGMMEFGWFDASVAVSERFCGDINWRLICHDPERGSVEDAITEILVALQESQ